MEGAAQYGGAMKDMELLGVRVELPTNQPIVLLRERGGRRCLPIWIGAAEASAIAYAQQGVVPPRPLTHDLLLDVITQLGHVVTHVRIHALRDGAFHAELVLTAPDGTSHHVDARSSDAIALALRANTPILAPEALLAEAGIEMDDESSEDPESPGGVGQSEDVLAEFKEFLDQVSADDFDLPGETPGKASDQHE